AKECPELVRIGDYHIARSTVARATTASDDAPLSGNDLRAMVRRVGDLSARVRCGYTAVGPMVLAHLANQGFTDEEKLMVRGPGYANLVCALNAGLAECVGDSGLLDGDRHLRLDDDWNWGGIWRVERYDDKPPDHSRFHPLMPLGLGYASTTSNGATVAQPPPSEPLIEIADRHWTVTLRKLDIDCGDLPLSPAAIPQLPQEARIVMELSVVGEKSYGRTARPIDRERRMLRDIDYPPEFFPGVILRCSLGMGNRVVMVQAHPLTIPVTVEEMTLTLEHDPEVFKRDLGLVPIDRKVFRGTRTLADQVAMVFRLHGRVTEDGGRALTAEEVLGRLLGADIHPETAQAVLIALTGMDLDFDDGVYTWRPRLTRRTSARERVKIQAARSSASGRRLTRRIAPRTVAMHLRHYVKRQPSTGKVNSYVQALIDNKAAHRLPSELPPGYSWVKPYPVGPRGGE
ncbi:MAG: hypothetical protein ACRDGB_12385, partial [Candidatus Limnocylindria bacterium]